MSERITAADVTTRRQDRKLALHLEALGYRDAAKVITGELVAVPPELVKDLRDEAKR